MILTSAQQIELTQLEANQKILGIVPVLTSVWNKRYQRLKQEGKFEQAKTLIQGQIAYQQEIWIPKMQIAKIVLPICALILLLIFILNSMLHR
ncbi:hypothetical protein EXS71_04315 [Candidatus Uhrbacteria bacterium]|nr:hypothetical protein [Candidatus Uhrbacteria bacterium]